MIFLVAALLVIVTAGFLVLHDRQNSRHAKQVSDLCQRLQAPATAVAQYVIADEHNAPSHLPYDDDGAFMKHLESISGSTD